MDIGQILRSRYKIIKVLGSGGFGDTYLAEDIDLPNCPKCVVKKLKTNHNPQVLDLAQRLFENEAQVLYCLGNESDRIPKLFAHFEEHGGFYLVQEFVDGEDLRREIYPGKRWTEAEVIQLIQGILEVFIVIQRQDIIHRDIKPANLMRRNKDGKIVVIDFGAVKQIGTLVMNRQGETVPSIVVGTAGYMPSEQATGQPKFCSDIHAIGMLAIYALTGIRPHELPKDPENGEVIWQNCANVSKRMAHVLNKMVRFHFTQRYQNAVDAMDAIATLKSRYKTKIHKTKIHIDKTKIEFQASPKSRREILKTLAWLGTGVSLTVVGGKLLQMNSNSTPTPSPITSLQSLDSNQPNTTIVTVDAQGEPIERRELNAKYFTENLGNDVSLKMVEIPGGTFTMGSPSDEVGRNDNEGPQHEVTVPSFFMGMYAVTQKQYQEIMGNNPANFPGNNRPVEQVSWNDAVEFCRKLSQKTRRNYRLPSEAEWEYACRAGTTTPFYFGETITTNLANYNGTAVPYAHAPQGEHRKKTTKVGIFPPNAFGLYDMHGNVWEWCQDIFHQSYEEAPTDGSAWDNKNPSMNRVLRGGSWFHDPGYCRSASRISDLPGKSNINIGLRVVCVV